MGASNGRRSERWASPDVVLIQDEQNGGESTRTHREQRSERYWILKLSIYDFEDSAADVEGSASRRQACDWACRNYGGARTARNRALQLHLPPLPALPTGREARIPHSQTL